MRVLPAPLCGTSAVCGTLRVHVPALQVAAVCIYVYCRLEARPYMLIDFADHISVNIYQLGKCACMRMYTCGASSMQRQHGRRVRGTACTARSVHQPLRVQRGVHA